MKPEECFPRLYVKIPVLPTYDSNNQTKSNTDHEIETSPVLKSRQEDIELRNAK